MHKFLPLFLAAILCSFAGCANKKKSSAHIYEGDAPTIHHFNEPETAGGRVNPY